ncbi:MAG TPA: Gfo/Idh/MocA family oxidoreductase [Verrucomicrobiae bacterium]|nr:Gfo/Idh/MocA family oxidoreductase [Verrucomicrobiae bacterium]
MNNPRPLITPENSLSRRRFLKYSSLAAGAAALATGPYIVRGQNLNNKLNVAVVGAGGKGASDTDSVAKLGENIVALCDVDQKTLTARGEKYPGAKRYQDYRKMFDELKEYDAVIVATPDHHHAPAALRAMKLGKHVYVQKPLTHSVSEARSLRQAATEYKVATQMGNQGSAENGLRRSVELIQSGAIGAVRQVHVWSNRPIWPQGIGRPPGEDPVPSTLDWDIWIGPAPMRPYKEKVYHDFAWRGWQDFGTGALGDMACHTANMPFRALKLGYPTSIEAESSVINKETYPSASNIRFEFPAREGMPPVTLFWYDGGLKPFEDTSWRVLDYLESTKDKDGVPKPRKLPGSGCLLIGDKGHLFSPDDYGAQSFLLPQKDFAGFQDPTPSIPRSPGHYKEWVDACKGGPKAYSNFDIAAYLTEIILLGCVALRVGKRLEWDGPNMRALNAPEAAQFVKREYRPGWAV